MDTSETYIKMCEKAQEIQDLRSGGMLDVGMVGDWWAVPVVTEDGIGYQILCLGSVYNKLNFRFPSYVWLPRQDQLQEMISMPHPQYDWQNSSQTTWWACGIAVFARETNGQFTSMEQLWLTFVMKEKYNKVWTGQDWNEAKLDKLPLK